MKKSINKKIIIITCLVGFFTFFFGYYISYRMNEKEKTKVEIIQEIMENEWYYGIDDENIKKTIEDKMILGMMDMEKDPYTRYLTSLGSLSDSFVGVGISVSIYGDYFIIEEVNSKHAIDGGLKVNDILISIDGNDLKNKTLDELNQLISGKSNVSLRVLRNNVEIGIDIQVIEYNPITVFTKEYQNGIAYVRITEFNMYTAEEVNTYFSSLSNEYNKLILDLRGNPGGYVDTVNKVLDLFVGKDKVSMITKDKNGNATVVKTFNDSCYLFNEIVVLIDENSASGAEALSAALDYHLDDIVTLYGNTTYGKGSAQKTYYFEDGTYFHYTYALWETPAGYTINKKGVEPEIVSKNTGISSLDIYMNELELYDYGEDVLSIQKFLNILGYYNGPLHSFIDEEVVSSIKLFQQAEGLEETGKIDMVTIRYMAKLIYDDKVAYLENELQAALGSMSS